MELKEMDCVSLIFEAHKASLLKYLKSDARDTNLLRLLTRNILDLLGIGC